MWRQGMGRLRRLAAPSPVLLEVLEDRTMLSALPSQVFNLKGANKGALRMRLAGLFSKSNNNIYYGSAYDAARLNDASVQTLGTFFSTGKLANMSATIDWGDGT